MHGLDCRAQGTGAGTGSWLAFPVRARRRLAKAAARFSLGNRTRHIPRTALPHCGNARLSGPARSTDTMSDSSWRPAGAVVAVSSCEAAPLVSLNVVER